MPAFAIHRRVLVVGADGPCPPGVLRDAVYESLISLMPSGCWELIETANIAQARFLLAGQDCDVIVVDGSLANDGWTESLGWLGAQIDSPLIVVSAAAEAIVTPALHLGCTWMPSDVVGSQPVLLAKAMERAVWLGQERRHVDLTCEQLNECHARIDRLLNLLWESAPGSSVMRWYSQRYMLERLDEELARTHRRKGCLALVLGELRTQSGELLSSEQSNQLTTWAALRIAQNKRKCDVAGQYGLQSFMMLLPQAERDEALGACRRLSHVLAHPPHAELPAMHACFGLAHVPHDTPSIEVLLRRAEDRLERAREASADLCLVAE